MLMAMLMLGFARYASAQVCFEGSTAAPVGAFPSSVTSADLNGDGRADLATANTGSYTVSVLLGQGDGTFVSQVQYGVGTSPRSVTSADLDGDGSDEVVLGVDGTTVGMIARMLRRS